MWRPCVAKTHDFCNPRDKVTILLQGLWVILDWTLLPFRKLCPCGLRSWCLPNVRILVTRQLIRSCLIRTEQTKTIPVGATAKMAQLRTAPPTWLWQRGLRPCAPGHSGLLHKKPERFHIQTIMWLEVPLPLMWLEVLQFRFHTWNILWLEVPPPHKEYTET